MFNFLVKNMSDFYFTFENRNIVESSTFIVIDKLKILQCYKSIFTSICECLIYYTCYMLAITRNDEVYTPVYICHCNYEKNNDCYWNYCHKTTIFYLFITLLFKYGYCNYFLLSNIFLIFQ